MVSSLKESFLWVWSWQEHPLFHHIHLEHHREMKRFAKWGCSLLLLKFFFFQGQEEVSGLWHLCSSNALTFIFLSWEILFQKNPVWHSPSCSRGLQTMPALLQLTAPSLQIPTGAEMLQYVAMMVYSIATKWPRPLHSNLSKSQK